MSASQSGAHESDWLEATLTVSGAHGLHARPAIRLSRSARRYAARIQICAEGAERWVDAKSVAQVMGLQVETGRTIRLRALGADAEAALAGLRQLVEKELAEGDDAG